ncbi:MAG: DUF4956 domain-containing protein [Planctomycetota bacterium]
MNIQDLFRESALEDLRLVPVLLDLALVLVLGQLLAWHFRRYSPVLSNKRRIAPVLVFIAATTMLVITIVKTSLALSLGLVGALSIIRFRTPIKEPEELAYLFLAIALGIGLGADQRLVTTVLFLGILLYLGVSRHFGGERTTQRMLVHVETPLGTAAGDPSAAQSALSAILSEAMKVAREVDLRRVDAVGQDLVATLAIDLVATSQVGTLLTRLREALPSSTISLVESGSVE